MRTIIAKLKEQQLAGKAIVLVTLIATEGSTYRRPGARMVITEDGQFHGLVSGGCLEGDLVLHAKKVFFDQKSRIVEYDMRAEEEGAWGLALGCNGLVRIHLQYVAHDSQSDVLNVCELADKSHRSVLLLSDLSEKNQGVAPTALYVDGEFKSEQIEESNLGQSWQEIKAQGLQNPSGKNQSAQNKASIFFDDEGTPYLAEWVQPQFHLLVLGAGPDASPVCTMAKLAGWFVTLVDHRVAYVNKAKILDADLAVNAEPENLAEKVNLDSVDATLLMSHNLNADTEYFTALMETNIAYIGMLGPKDRSEIIFGRQTNLNEAFLERVHAPVGLDLGGEGPEAIALSIIAEIQAHMNSRSGMSLKDKSTGIHD